MAVDELRARYLSDRVLTATPAQRVVMLYDRLALDLTLAGTALGADDLPGAGGYLSHANLVIAELLASLDVTAGGPAENLAAIYPYLLGEVIAVRGGAHDKLPGVQSIVATLRDAWAQAADIVVGRVVTGAVSASGGWVELSAMDSKQAWERVLAAVEADARRAEALLQPAPAEPEPAHAPDALAGIPADWLLPAHAGELPPLSDMPPVPPELRERIEALRTQIAGLQAELAGALREWRQPPRLVLATAAPAEHPVYVDRRL